MTRVPYAHILSYMLFMKVTEASTDTTIMIVTLNKV